MVRQLYRMYLYIVSIALLVLAAVGLAVLLNTIFSYTPLRGAYRAAPTQPELVQSIVFAVTAWIIAAALGALHLRLIRRDIALYPEAGSGAVRAFFLNAFEAIAAFVTVFTGSATFSALAYAGPYNYGDNTVQPSAAIAALLMTAALEMERRRIAVAPGAATVFQRLHLFGVPVILLAITVLGSWNAAMQTTQQDLLIRTNIYSPLDPNACGPGVDGPVNGVCSLPNPLFLWLAVLVPIAAIAFYAFVARRDLRSLIRMVAHIVSLCVGIGALIVGVVRGVELLLRAMFGVAVQWSDVAHPWNAQYDFLSPLSIGVLVVVVYGLWLRAERDYLPPGAQITQLVTEAVAAVIFAVAFWWGVGRVAYTAFQLFGNSTGGSLGPQWAAALALVVGGLAYIPLAVHLRVSTAEDEHSAPRRGFILALLAGGIVTGAVGLTMTLYAVGTNLLGAPLGDWQQTVRAGLAALVVGVILVVSYGWTALQEHSIESLFRRLKEATALPKAPAAPTQPQRAAPEVPEAVGDITAKIEDILKQYGEHTISLKDATERIKALSQIEAQASDQQPVHV